MKILIRKIPSNFYRQEIIDVEDGSYVVGIETVTTPGRKMFDPPRPQQYIIVATPVEENT